MAGHDTASSLIHEFESRLDSLRSGKQEGDDRWADAMLGAVDAVRDLIDHGGADPKTLRLLEQAHGALASLETPRSTETTSRAQDSATGRAPELDIGFPLSGEEMETLRKALARSERPYILEKLIENSLPTEVLSALPIFTAYRRNRYGYKVANQTSRLRGPGPGYSLYHPDGRVGIIVCFIRPLLSRQGSSVSRAGS